MLRRICAAVLLFLAAAPLRAAGTRDVAQAFVDAYRAGDVAAVRALWAPSAEEARFRAAFDRALRAGCMTIVRGEVETVDEATARVVFDIVEPQRVATRRATLHLIGGRIVSLDWEADAIAAALLDGTATLDEAALSPDVNRALANLALREINRGNRPRARVAAGLANRVAGATGDRAGLALAVVIAGALDGLEGNLPAYVEATQRAYELAKDAGDPAVLARVLNYIGRTHERRSDLITAREWYARAAAMSDQVEDPATVMVLLSSVNKLEYSLGDFAGALEHVRQQLNLAEEQGDDLGVITAQIGLGGIYRRIGDDELAVAHLQRAADLATRAKNDQFRGRALMMLSSAYEWMGRHDRTQEMRDEALVLARSTHDPITETEALKFRAVSHIRNHAYAEAMRDLDASMAVCEAAKQPLYCSAQRALAAAVLVARGDWREGAAAAEDAAARLKGSGDFEGYADAKVTAGKAYEKLKDDDRALAAYRDAIATIEGIRSSLGGVERQQVLYLSQHEDAFVSAIGLLADRGRIDEALELAERAKGRALLDILGTGRAASPLTADERRREAELEQRIAALNRDLLRKPSPELTRDLESARAEYDSFEASLHATHARLRAQRGEVQPLTAAEIRSLVAPDQAVLEYVAGEKRSFLFVITHGRIRLHTIPAGAEALATTSGRFVAALEQRSLATASRGRTLAKLVFDPAAEEIAGARVLAIVPDGALWRIPFEALKLRDGRYLLERHAVYYAPSVSVLREVTAHRRAPASGTLLAIGNPKLSPELARHVASLYRDETLGPLPEAETEVRALRDLYGGAARVMTGAAARESVVKPELPRYRVLHFATHGRFDDRNPMYSHLVLATAADDNEDGLLESWEVMNADLRSDLAVLSACQTARGRAGAGEGLIGMSWALFAAGCPSSVLSQWNVSSASTAKLMISFHRALLSAPGRRYAKALALRKAKLELLHGERFGHPFYWSAFVLLGAPD